MRWKRTAAWALVLACVVLLGVITSGEGATQARAQSVFRWRPFLGPFHSLVLHYPIGFLTLAFLLELYRFRRPSEDLRHVITFTIGLSLVASIVAATLGLMRASSGGYEGRNMEVHRYFGMAVPLLAFVALVLQRRSTLTPTLAWMSAYRAALISALAALVIAGHYGGNLAHGSKYLVQNAPRFIKQFIEPQNASESLEQFFVEKVQPVFEAKCIRCHGPEKQKGDYRLDQAEMAARGGSSGEPAIAPRDPLASEMVRRVLLPRDDDEAMPPDGKEPLTAEEIMDIVHWIQDGATFVARQDAPVAASVNH